MPLISSGYEAPFFLRSGHLHTLFPRFFRRVRGIRYERERIETADGDFLDLDWSRIGSGRVAVLTHGLEGSTGAAYIRGMARAMNRRGWDALAWNLRGRSGSPNRLPGAYHSGLTKDLGAVVRHAFAAGSYREAALLGFSLGGNLMLKWLGERGAEADARLRAAVAFSVPCDLASSAAALSRWTNRHYSWHFLRSLRRTIRLKAEAHPEAVSLDGYGRLRTIRDFDDRYTAPLHGFADAEDYYAQSSSRPFLPRVRVPTLLVNAADDPFLAPPCYPFEEARASRHFFLEVPETGGHVGFVAFRNGGEYWSERRAAAFLEGAG